MSEEKQAALVRMFMAALAAGLGAQAAAARLNSPDGRISVDVGVNPAGMLGYSVARDGQPVILQSALGLRLAGADLATGLTLVAA